MNRSIDHVTVIDAPADIDYTTPSVMLAGGSSEWRTEIIRLLRSFRGTLLNPIRESWPEDEAGLRNQIAWERQSLREASLCLFWFHAESDCPNTMFELGYALQAARPMVVGVSPAFSQKRNVMMQIELERSGMPVASTLEQLAEHTLDFFAGEQK